MKSSFRCPGCGARIVLTRSGKPLAPSGQAGKHPEHRPGLERALRLIVYHRAASSHEAYLYALMRLEFSIRAELENGGPLTFVTMDAKTDAAKK